MTACQMCGAAVGDAFVCTGDARRLELVLGDVPALVADLETVLAKLTKYADEAQRVSGSRDKSLPYSIPAGEARQALHAVLTSWVRIVHAEHPEPRQLPQDRTSACARWLMFYPEWMRRQTWASEAITNICDAIGDVRHVLDAPVNRGSIFIGTCPEDCEGEIRVFLPRDLDATYSATCNVDPLHTWDPTQWARLGKRMLREANA